MLWVWGSRIAGLADIRRVSSLCPNERKRLKRKIAEDYIRAAGSQLLRSGKVTEKVGYFEVELLTKKEGAFVSKISVSKI